MRKRILVIALLLTVLGALFVAPPPAKCVDKFCSSCQTQCEQDYWIVIDNCTADGTSILTCQIRNRDWMHNCGVVMCPVCPWYENY